MSIAGLGVLAVVAGTAGGIAAYTSDDERVVTVLGEADAVVDQPAATVPVQPPTGQTGLGAGPSDPGSGSGSTGRVQAERDADETRSEPGEPDRTATRSPRRDHTAAPAPVSSSASPAAPVRGARPAAPPASADSPAPLADAGSSAPQVRTKQIAETKAIPFGTNLIEDPSLPPGSREIDRAGVPGKRLLRYEVTYTSTKETSRRLLDSTVTREPKDEIVAFGPPRKDSPPSDSPPSDSPPSDSQDGDGDGDGHNGDGHNSDGQSSDEPGVELGHSAVDTDDDLSWFDLPDRDDMEDDDLDLPCPDAEKEQAAG